MHDLVLITFLRNFLMNFLMIIDFINNDFLNFWPFLLILSYKRLSYKKKRVLSAINKTHTDKHSDGVEEV